MEYVPITGSDKNVGFGVVRRRLGEITNNAERFVWKKLHPTMTYTAAAAWTPCCWRSDVLLPPGAPDIYDDAHRLTQQFEGRASPAIKDLIVMTTFRFPDTSSLNANWERVRAFARQRLAIERRLPVVLAMHNPRAAGGANAAHIHVMALARQLDGAGFGTVARELTNDQGRDVLAGEWVDWTA